MEHEELTHSIIGAAMEVPSTLGPGFLEGAALKHKSKPDFIVQGKVIVEIKAVSQLTDIDIAQTINYLKATGYKVALLINFAGKSLQWKRLVSSV